jgi:hypothetical protein
MEIKGKKELDFESNLKSSQNLNKNQMLSNTVPVQETSHLNKLET